MRPLLVLAALLGLSAACDRDRDERSLSPPIDQSLRMAKGSKQVARPRTEPGRKLGAARTVTGKVSMRSDEAIVVDRAGRPPLMLRVVPSTSITIDGKRIDAGEIPLGTEVRVTFKPSKKRPVAHRIQDTGRQPVKGRRE